ncbi:short chain dehydrogenase [compost metagenome]
MPTFASNEQKAALLTRASSGIGEAAALSLVKPGYRVIGISRKAAPDEVCVGIRKIVCYVTLTRRLLGLLR